MRSSKKIIPGIVLLAMMLSMAPVGVPTAHAADFTPFDYSGCRTSGKTVQQCNAEQLTYNQQANANYKKDNPTTNECSLGNPVPCIAAMVYYVGPGLASNVAYIGAYFFSIVVQLSLQSTAYALDFISNGWTTVRDIANMAFIFILIYIALTVMLFAETSGTIKQLALVVVIALLVNFSFFFTRLIIDTGNILAIQFYNAIPSEQYIDSKGTTTAANINGVKDLSFSIMGAVQLQKLYGSDAFTKASNACGKDSNGQWCGLIVSTVVYVAVAAMFWMLFFAFLQVGIKFLLRIVGLWFLIIASPLAFVAKTIPKTAGYFDQWFKKLIEFSIYPAIFLFMFLILTGFTKQLMSADGKGGGTILDAAMNSAGAGATGIGAAIATVGIRMGFVLALMYVALHVSDWVVKEGSGLASKVSGGVLSAGKFAAKWGPGWAAGAAYRRTGGALAAGASNALEKSTWANRTGTLGGMIGYRLRRNITEPLANTSLGTVASTYRGREEFLDKRKKEMGGNLNNIKAREDAKRLAEINKTWEKDEGELEMWRGQERRGIKLDPPAQARYKKLEELNSERAVLSERVTNMTPTQVTSLKGAEIEGIIKQISESQLKAIKESGKYTGQVVDGIMRKWHEENKKAPMNESIKQLGLLSKVHETLKGMKVNLSEMDKYAGRPPGTKVTIDLKGAEEMKKQIVNEKESYESIRDNREAKAAERTAAGEKAKKLNKALEHAEKIIEKIKDVPEQVGNVAAPAAFEHTAS